MPLSIGRWRALAAPFVGLVIWSISAQAAASCEGVCGGFSWSGLCWCDDQCATFGLCCSDYTPECVGCAVDARSWRPATLLQEGARTGLIERTFPDVGSSDTGASIALWQWRGGSSFNGVRAIRFNAGTWSTRTDLATGSGTTTTSRGRAARVAVGANGHAFATLANSEMVTFTPATGWTTLSSAGFPAARTAVDRAVDGAGNAFLLYQTDLNLVLRRRSAWLNAWEPERVLGPANPDADLAVNAAGDRAVIFTPNYGYVVARQPWFGFGSSTVRVTSTGGRQGRVGVDDDGTALAVWIDTGNSIRAARVTALGAGAQQTLVAYGTEEVSNLRLAVNGSGQAIASWVHRIAGTDFEIAAATYDPATGWSTPTTVVARAIDTLNPSTFPDQDVTIDACGAGLLVHEDRMYKCHAYRYTRTGGWGATRHTFEGPAIDIRISGAANGTATAVWDDDQNEVLAARFE